MQRFGLCVHGTQHVDCQDVFAVLGLRSPVLRVGGHDRQVPFLKASLATVLAIVGLKMLLAEPLKTARGPGFKIYLPDLFRLSFGESPDRDGLSKGQVWPPQALSARRNARWRSFTATELFGVGGLSSSAEPIKRRLLGGQPYVGVMLQHATR